MRQRAFSYPPGGGLHSSLIASPLIGSASASYLEFVGGRSGVTELVTLKYKEQRGFSVTRWRIRPPLGLEALALVCDVRNLT